MRTLEAQLDAVIAEGRRLRAQLEEVSPDRRAELLDLVRKQGGRSPA